MTYFSRLRQNKLISKFEVDSEVWDLCTIDCLCHTVASHIIGHNGLYNCVTYFTKQINKWPRTIFHTNILYLKVSTFIKSHFSDDYLGFYFYKISIFWWLMADEAVDHKINFKTYLTQ